MQRNPQEQTITVINESQQVIDRICYTDAVDGQTELVSRYPDAIIMHYSNGRLLALVSDYSADFIH